VSVHRPGRHITPASITRLQAALVGIKLLGAAAGEYDQWPVVLTVGAEEYARYSDTPGRLTADVDAYVYRSELVGSMPLTRGAVLRHGATRFEMLQVARHPDGCSVLVRQSMTGSFGRASDRRPYQLLLRNASRGEALVGDSDFFMQSESAHVGNWSVSGYSEGFGFSFVHLAQRYPARGPLASAPRIDAAWLDGADLILVDTVYAGRVARSIAADGFRMGSPSPAPAP